MPGIDGLRAIAVIGVILYHLNISWLPGGFLGVTVFFVLSGYLITDLLIDEWKHHNKIDFIQFITRRFRRLAPALIVMLVLVTAWVTLTNHSSFEKLQVELLPSFFYFSNWYYIFHEYSYFDTFGPPSPLTHIWSLAIEEQFYLLWPLIIILVCTFLKRNRFRVLAVMIGVILSTWLMTFLYVPGTDPSRVYYGTDTRAFSLLLGAALAFVWPSQRLAKTLPRQASKVLEAAGATGLLVIVMLFFLTSQYDHFLYRGGMFILSLFTTILVGAITHPASILAKWLSVKPIQWIGIRSYGIYLWHYPIIILTTPAVNTEGFVFWRVFLQIAATLIISALSYRFVETPIRTGRLKFTPIRIALCSCAVVFIIIIGIGTSFVTKPSIEDEKEIVKETFIPIDEPEVREDISIPEPETKSITIIGDSVIYDVAPFLKNVYPDAVIDYRVGRQMSELPDVINHLKENGQLGEYIIIQIGTNGPFVKSDLIQVIEGLGNKKVYLVNCRVPRPWENTVNSTLAEVVRSLPNTTLIDWYSVSAGHAEFFVNDGVHLTRAGGETYANLLVKHLKK